MRKIVISVVVIGLFVPALFQTNRARLATKTAIALNLGYLD